MFCLYYKWSVFTLLCQGLQKFIRISTISIKLNLKTAKLFLSIFKIIDSHHHITLLLGLCNFWPWSIRPLIEFTRQCLSVGYKILMQITTKHCWISIKNILKKLLIKIMILSCFILFVAKTAISKLGNSLIKKSVIYSIFKWWF